MVVEQGLKHAWVADKARRKNKNLAAKIVLAESHAAVYYPSNSPGIQ
jgi:hypothetical protein